MDDRNLLELAAKAAELYVKYPQEDHNYNLVGLKVKPHRQAGRNTSVLWNPLTDDGDALRLAIKLRMCIDPWGAGATALAIVNNRALVSEPHYGDDPERATRRAIVRAAAEIGKALP